MTVAAYRDRASGRYPITLADIRESVPMLFGEEPTPDVLDAADADPVQVSDPPSFDPATHSLTEGAPERVAGSWRQTWIVVAIPPPPVPASVTMRQARIALSRAGLLSKADTAIAGMAGQAGEEARIEWEYAADLKRDHPLIAALGQSLGLSAEAIDQLFRTAETI